MYHKTQIYKNIIYKFKIIKKYFYGIINKDQYNND